MPRSSALYRCKERLKARLTEIPATPGVYRFYDVSGALVYVGKSVRLRDRVRSYFTGQPGTKKLRRLRHEVSDLDWVETGSELEALLLESRLVKQNQPRFNVLLKGFVPLPYVRIDLRDPFPRLEITRRPQADGATYYGPFRSQDALEAAVGALADSLALRDCAAPGDRLPSRACHRHEFGTCSAPCLGTVTIATYREAAAHACGVFEGREQQALELLRVRMERAADRLQFETAARLRDAVRHIRNIAGRQQALTSAVRGLSIVAACPSRTGEALCFFVFRSGRLVQQHTASVPMLRNAAEAAASRLLAPFALPAEETGRIDAAALDEIQIVTAWMRQKTREGSYWELPPEAPPGESLTSLTEWLITQASPAADAKRAA